LVLEKTTGNPLRPHAMETETTERLLSRKKNKGGVVPRLSCLRRIENRTQHAIRLEAWFESSSVWAPVCPQVEAGTCYVPSGDLLWLPCESLLRSVSNVNNEVLVSHGRVDAAAVLVVAVGSPPMLSNNK